MVRTSHAIIFCTPFDVDMIAVNLATGGYGYGHVALWGGQVQGDEPIVLDASMEHGVGFRRLMAMTRGFPYRAHYLDDTLGDYVFARALAKIGAPYDFTGLLRPRYRPDAATCSALVGASLPPQLRAACQPPRRPISPNDLARGLGVPPWSIEP